MKNPRQMEDDPLEGSSNTQWHQVTGNIHGSSASKPKKTKIEVQFSKWICWPSRSGCRDCDNHKYVIKSLEKDILLIGEETIYEEFRQIEELRQYKALAHYQTEQLAKLKYELQKVRDASCSLNHHSKAHLTPDDPDKSQRHSLREQLAKGPRLAEHYVSMLSPENDKDDEHHTEEEVEKVEKPAALRLSQELLEAKEQKAPEDPLDEIYWTPSVQGKLSDCHQPYSSALSSLKNQLTCPALDVACEYSSLKATELHGPPRQPLRISGSSSPSRGTYSTSRLSLGKALGINASTQATCPQGTWSGDLSHSLSEVQASQTQLEPSTLVPSCLRIELDEVFHCGSGSASQGLSSTTCSFTVNVDSDSPLLHYGFLHTQSGSNSLAQTPAVFPTFSGVQNRNQDPELVLASSIQIKNPLQMEGSADNTQGDQVPGNIHASTDLKLKIKRKLPFSNGDAFVLGMDAATCHVGSDHNSLSLPLRQV
ncbi:hypothetical protein P7K49_016505 [Saguinus oedipus]|uniref:Olduvai domain-containing protein n=1 Tax=Saguinus oedipus TaxID=9490 RepID=A0ABQ9VC84_SAGOE|nr:hypothetical protein P7K49_016505 [Saguinus oedipus]